jgi:hypothetical protein
MKKGHAQKDQGHHRERGAGAGSYSISRAGATDVFAFRNLVLAKEGWIDADSVLRQLRRASERGLAANHLWYCYVLECWAWKHSAGANDRMAVGG